MSFTVLLLVLFEIGYSLADGHCDGIDPHKRLDCGYYGITKQQCVDRHCCYDNSVQGVPWCFKSKKDLENKCQSIAVHKRADCGWIGITKVVCQRRGCCYDDRGYNGESKYCFYPRGSKCYGIPPPKRRDCGYPGIQREKCENDRGCCFDHTVRGVPWCFHGHERPNPPPNPPTNPPPSPPLKVSPVPPLINSLIPPSIPAPKPSRSPTSPQGSGEEPMKDAYDGLIDSLLSDE
ncbi:integumentary mucin C.1-like [Stylophora pistillata]|uniref:Integumentary mucin C.1 n=1 Tax=Stylophora pistillata TaxID=50429 RepID=A0A2B4SIZ7_STYPI|nr:integumentary mucin C.1-like [Stylophora pistillata]PFX29063.1 Integumentary mucin C.1 [Stylophora pistillata]